MKKLSVLLAFLMLLFTDFAMAQGAAVVASVTGSAQVQTGSANPRTLRLGDEVRQGDTVSTAPNSSVVLKFDDGEVAALTQNSRMTITAYQYQPASRTGNVLLSLIRGGMRAVTGLIGRTQPERVAYRAATVTIGVRGTAVNMATDGVNAAASVDEGTITFTYNGVTVVVTVGQAAFTANGQITHDTAAIVFGKLPQTFQDAIRDAGALQALVNAAGNQPREGGEGQGEGNGQGQGNVNGGPNVGGGNSAGGGGSVSQH
jgi:uncharacterized membrane protein YgcG